MYFFPSGAVQFGLQAGTAAVRRTPLSYGVGILNRFDPDVHQEEKKVERNEEQWCTDVFDAFVVIDQPVAIGDVVLRSYTPIRADQTLSQIDIYSSDVKHPYYVTDNGVRKCGSLTLDISELDKNSLPKTRELQIRMQFGENEIKVSAVDVGTGTNIQVSVECLHT